MKKPIHRALAAAAVGLLLALAMSAAGAAGDADEPAKPDALSPARTLIQQKNWSAAIDELKRVNATGNADWNNLMGFSLRKGAAPDYAAAEKFYDAALRIDPKHRGALEYSGELYLMLGDLGQAEQRLATLDKVCGFGCEELSALKQAVQAYKANGNKVVGQGS